MEISRSLAPPPLATAPLTELVPPGTQDPYLKAVDDVYLYNKYRPQDGRSLAELRRELAPAEVGCLDDLPALSADGLTRTSIHYMGPQTLRGQCDSRGWEKVGDMPLVDVVVIGAGPGGLATSYHLAVERSSRARPVRTRLVSRRSVRTLCALAAPASEKAWAA